MIRASGIDSELIEEELSHMVDRQLVRVTREIPPNTLQMLRPELNLIVE